MLSLGNWFVNLIAHDLRTFDQGIEPTTSWAVWRIFFLGGSDSSQDMHRCPFVGVLQMADLVL